MCRKHQSNKSVWTLSHDSNWYNSQRYQRSHSLIYLSVDSQFESTNFVSSLHMNKRMIYCNGRDFMETMNSLKTSMYTIKHTSRYRIFCKSSNFFRTPLDCFLVWLNHFKTIFHFYKPWKHLKNWGFLMFSGGVAM